MTFSLSRLFGFGKPRHTPPAVALDPKFLISAACIDGLRDCLAPALQKGHEGIAYLLGRTDGNVTLAVSVFRPEAKTTPGSFFVDPRAMARCVRAAANLNLQVVAQVHTHPGGAYHSDGDVEGARIRYAGYASIVLPDYGRWLPGLNGAAIFISTKTEGWLELAPEEVVIIPGHTP